jgi:alpha,alpha-trehalose phosphorylase
VFAALASKTGVEMEEVKEWRKAAENMYIPYDEDRGIHPQDDSFLEKELWDLKATPPEKFPLLLFFHPLVIYRYQVIKQADIILAMFLIGQELSPEQKKRNFDYYDPLTTGDSSLSSCIQSIVASEIGYADIAVEYARAALLMDLADVGGNVKDGCHIASMGGTWMMMVYGMAGMRDFDGILTFKPRRAPDLPSKIRFPLTYRGQILDVEMGPEGARYSLREGEGLMIRHEDEEILLSPQDPVVTRPIVTW